MSEAANQTMLAFLLQHQEEFGCDDKKGVLVSTALDLFCDLAQQAAILKLQIVTQGISPSSEAKDELQLLKDEMSGLSYILMMHFGNDVIYFKREDKQAIYTTVNKALRHRLLEQAPKDLAIRMLPYIRLVIEPLFSYNHFEDDGEVDVEEYDSEEESFSSDKDGDDAQEKTKVKKKKVVI